jgi:hypothetical protein
MATASGESSAGHVSLRSETGSVVDVSTALTNSGSPRNDASSNLRGRNCAHWQSLDARLWWSDVSDCPPANSPLFGRGRGCDRRLGQRDLERWTAGWPYVVEPDLCGRCRRNQFWCRLFIRVVVYHDRLSRMVPNPGRASRSSRGSIATWKSARYGVVDRLRFDAVFFRVWKEDVDHGERSSGGDPGAGRSFSAR